MLSEGYIDKDDTGERGKKVYYFLTEKTKQLQRLKILKIKSKKQVSELNRLSEEEKRQNMYLMIFFLGRRTYYPFKTEGQLRDFLSEAGSSMNDLVLYTRPREHYRDGKRLVLTNWKTGSDIHVTNVEDLSAPNSDISYNCILPGISPSETFKQSGRVFEHINITQTEMEDTFHLAYREGALKIVMEFRNELRYEIADPSLADFFFDCWDLFRLILRKLEIVWRTIRAPNAQEVKWLELLRSRRQADSIRMQAYHQRHSLRKTKKRNRILVAKGEVGVCESEINGFLMHLLDKHTDTIRKYRFPTERILEIINPISLQKNIV